MTNKNQSHIKHIEIQTKQLFKSLMLGSGKSLQKGTGLEFDQIRQYTFGDDIRFIDWNASARSQNLAVKQFHETKKRTVYLVMDVSASMDYGVCQSKFNRACEIASVLGLAASWAGDDVGLLLFADSMVKKMLPKKNSGNVYQMVDVLSEQQLITTQSSLASVEQFFIHEVKNKNGIIILFSDLIDVTIDAKKWKILSSLYDVMIIRVLDELERNFTITGMLNVIDPETNQLETLAITAGQAQNISRALQERLSEQDKKLRQAKIDFLTCYTNKPYLPSLIQFFRQRMYQ